MNLIVDDWTMWLVNIWKQLVCNLEKNTKLIQGKCWWKLQGKTKIRSWQSNMVSITNYQNYTTFFFKWIIKSLVHSLSQKKSMMWLLNSNFQMLWKFIICFIFPCKNNTMQLPSLERFVSYPHLLRLIVNKITKWRMFSIQSIKLSTLIPHSLVWIWCKWMQLGNN
jgi:uncharacterized membrane protein